MNLNFDENWCFWAFLKVKLGFFRRDIHERNKGEKIRLETLLASTLDKEKGVNA